MHPLIKITISAIANCVSSGDVHVYLPFHSPTDKNGLQYFIRPVKPKAHWGSTKEFLEEYRYSHPANIGQLEIKNFGFAIRKLSIYTKFVVFEVSDPYAIGINDRHDRTKLKERLDFYAALGGSSQPPTGLEADINATLKEEERLHINQGLAKGFFMSAPVTDITVIQGGFSQEVFSDPALQTYLKNSYSDRYMRYIPAGFAGSGYRTLIGDAIIESHLRTQLKWSASDVAVWLTSTNGRHFSEELTGAHIANWGYANYASPSHVSPELSDSVRATLAAKYQSQLNSIVVDNEALSTARGTVSSKDISGGFTNNFWSFAPSEISPTSYLKSPHRTVHTDRLAEITVKYLAYRTPAGLLKWLASPNTELAAQFFTSAQLWVSYPYTSCLASQQCQDTQPV